MGVWRAACGSQPLLVVCCKMCFFVFVMHSFLCYAIHSFLCDVCFVVFGVVVFLHGGKNGGGATAAMV